MSCDKEQLWNYEHLCKITPLNAKNIQIEHIVVQLNHPFNILTFSGGGEEGGAAISIHCCQLK